MRCPAGASAPKMGVVQNRKGCFEGASVVRSVKTKGKVKIEEKDMTKGSGLV